MTSSSSSASTKMIDELIRNAERQYGRKHEEVKPAQSAEQPWPKLHDAALYGLAGDVVNTIRPQTESDPVAILVHVLVYFGNQIGRVPYYQVESTRHYTNLFAALVGDTAEGRKGTAEGRVRAAVEFYDKEWVDTRVHSGLSSGEGFINRSPRRT